MKASSLHQTIEDSGWCVVRPVAAIPDLRFAVILRPLTPLAYAVLTSRILPTSPLANTYNIYETTNQLNHASADIQRTRSD